MEWEKWRAGAQKQQYLKRVKIDAKSIKKLGEKGAWAYPGTAQIF